MFPSPVNSTSQLTVPPKASTPLHHHQPSPACHPLARSLLQSLRPSILASLSSSPQRKPNHASAPTTPTVLAEYPTTGSQGPPDKEPSPRAFEALQSGPAPPPASPHTTLPPALPAPRTGFAFKSLVLTPSSPATGLSHFPLPGTFSLLPPLPNA